MKSPLALALALALSVVAAAQEPAEAAAAPAPELAAPATVAEALQVELSDLGEQLATQTPDRLRALLEVWQGLVEQQHDAVEAAARAPEGSAERARLDALRSDQHTLMARAEAVMETLAGKAGEDPATAAALDATRARLAAIREQESEETAQTGTVPQDRSKAQDLDLAVLEARLRPLTRSQVQEELGKWLELLQSKALEIRSVEVASLTAEEGEDIDRYNERAVSLRTERDALIRRVRTVIAALAEKKGDVEEATAYVDSLVVAPPITGLRAAWVTFRAWITSPDGGLALAKSIGLFAAILLAFRILSSLLGRFIDRTLRAMRKTSDLLRSFLVNSVRKVTMFIGIVIALSQLGVNIGPLLAAIGAAGFVIGFALQGTLSNFASGVMIMMYRPFEIGDAVTAAGVTGKVGSMTLVSTTIKTFDNQTIVVPNSKIWGDVITNITANTTRRVDMKFGISYGDDIGKAEAVLRDIVNKQELVLEEPEPVIQVHELGDSSVNFIVRPWARTDDYWKVYWSITRAVKERFDEAGVSIPFPQRDVHLHQVPAPSETAAAR